MPAIYNLFNSAAIYFGSNIHIKVLVEIILWALLALLLRYVIQKMALDKLKKTPTPWDDTFVKILDAPILWTVFLSGIYFSLEDIRQIIPLGDKIVVVILNLLIVIWAMALVRFTDFALEILKRKHLKENDLAFSDAVPFLSTLAKGAILAGALYWIADSWDFNVTPVLASAGIAGAALAFGAKDTIANFMGGISIFFDKTYKIGDFIVIDNEYSGTVTEIGIRSTKVKTLSNVLLVVPNSVMTTNAVINETGYDPMLRITVKIGVSYKADLDQVEQIILEAAKHNEHIMENPEPVVRYREFGDSAIIANLFATIQEPLQKNIATHELIKSVKKKFEEAGIEVPYPQQDIHIKEPKFKF